MVNRIQKKEPADLILLDLMLPGKSGEEVCRELRTFSNIPIIMVTAKTEEIDRLLGLELGADDYICKPFSPREVVARVKAVLRRSRAAVNEGPWLTGGPIRLNPETREVFVEQQPVNLTPNEFGLLEVMMKRPGRVYSRDELLNMVQGYVYAGYDRPSTPTSKTCGKNSRPLDWKPPSVRSTGSDTVFRSPTDGQSIPS